MNKIKCAVGAFVVLVLGSGVIAGLWIFIVIPTTKYLSENHYDTTNSVIFFIGTVCAIAMTGIVWYALYGECVDYHKRGKK